MSETLVRVEGISKKFCRSLKRSLWYGLQDLGNELGGRTHGGHGQLRKEEFWAVNDVNFELKRGECLGLIGRNGAGKTTLLRMLNGLIKPDRGRIEMRGRVGAMIALGAGFNPVLTGRENIYVNGAVLGLPKKNVDAKIEEIIDFADIREFIDSPVRGYSSGMAVRLGFSVAVKLIKPDILILDEVLAVGDQGFRAKCYEAVANLADESAVIFVSHQMPAVQRICTKALVLARGSAVFSGDTAAGIERYFQFFEAEEGVSRRSHGTGEATVHSAQLLDESGQPTTQCQHGGRYMLRFDLSVDAQYPEYDLAIAFLTTSQDLVAQCHSRMNRQTLKNDGRRQVIELTFDSQLLNPGRYVVNLVALDKRALRHLAWEVALLRFSVTGPFTGTAPVQLIATWRATG